MNEKRVKILFVGNGSNTNRGCEAIVRGTLRILQDTFHNIECVNVFHDIDNSEIYQSDIEDIVSHFALPVNYKNLVDRVIKAVSIRYAPRIWEQLNLCKMLSKIEKSDLVLSIGGDNYSLDYGLPRRYIQLGKYVKRQKKPFIIFGASIGPFEAAGPFKKNIINHLKNDVDQIHVREDRSYNYLVENGCTNIYRTADPAFLMDPVKPIAFELNESVLNSAIGLNISPLILKYIKSENPVEWIKKLIFELRKKTKRPIVLIYHVTSSHTDDYNLLKNIEMSLGDDAKDIYLPRENMSAPEIKWLISKLFCLIGSRTHATIAGFSSCVPTISIAYSVKAWGINEDIFGHTDYVISAENLTISKLVRITLKAIDEGKSIKTVLDSKMDEIRKVALSAGNHLITVLSKYELDISE